MKGEARRKNRTRSAPDRTRPATDRESCQAMRQERQRQSPVTRKRASAHPHDDQQHVCCLRPPARPQAAGAARLATNHRSSSATGQENGSSPAGAPEGRATSMRPTESEGVAEGEDEDEEGAVRSERSGPQSWALAPLAPPPAGGLRRSPDTRHYNRHSKPTSRRPDPATPATTPANK